MKTKTLSALAGLIAVSLAYFSCQKEIQQKKQEEGGAAVVAENAQKKASDPYNLDVDLYGQGNEKGSIKFRQDPDSVKIVTLDTKIQHLLPNHEYLLQRAVDVIIDGNCTGTAWLTLGLGLTPQSIMTNGGGNGHEELWRDLSAIPSGKVFDIHFRVVDAVDMTVVLTSDCYQYTVR